MKCSGRLTCGHCRSKGKSNTNRELNKYSKGRSDLSADQWMKIPPDLSFPWVYFFPRFCCYNQASCLVLAAVFLGKTGDEIILSSHTLWGRNMQGSSWGLSVGDRPSSHKPTLATPLEMCLEPQGFGSGLALGSALCSSLLLLLSCQESRAVCTCMG